MNKNLRRVEPSEHQIQAAIVEWAATIKKSYPNMYERNLSEYIIKIPNEGKRSFFTGKKMKKEGLKKGACDLFLAFPVLYAVGRIFCGLWIEVKTKKGKISDSQEYFMETMVNSGYMCCVVRSVDEGIQAIKDYLGMR